MQFLGNTVQKKGHLVQKRVTNVTFWLAKYIDLARANSEALVNNTCKQKKLNRLMLNGEANENGINRSN